MCTEPHVRGVVASSAIRPEPTAPPADPVGLTPVDAVTLTTLVDNSTDLLLTDQGPVRRHGLLAAATAAPRLAATVLDTGETADIPLAEHGFWRVYLVTDDHVIDIVRLAIQPRLAQSTPRRRARNA